MLPKFSVPTSNGPTEFAIEPGTSLIFVGANGGGKTRLAAHIEQELQLNAHRISAHRALNLNPKVQKVSEQEALSSLRIGVRSGTADYRSRAGSRWQRHEAVALLQDFDSLIQAMFAEQANRALKTHIAVRNNDCSPPPLTQFERLEEIWKRLLPHRQLHFSGDDIQVSAREGTARYTASEMSDGERAIFYLVGQTLVAANDTILIFDEPELHVHRSVMGKLWDELEAARPDCGFIFITHDLEFAAARTAQKYVIRDYDATPRWTIEGVPEDTGFDEEIATLILGSRRPILFVEGTGGSLDKAIYRCCFPEWTVIPRGSCEQVIHSVVTMRHNSHLTRVTCSGIVDADDHNEEDISKLRRLGIQVLPVSEIENIILLPAVSRAIAESNSYHGKELENKLEDLKSAIFTTLNSSSAIDVVVTRYCRRRIDRLLKKIDLSTAANVEEIKSEYHSRTISLRIDEIAQDATARIEDAMQQRDLPKLLANYDNKGLMIEAARHLKGMKKSDFESWLLRVLRNDSAPAVVHAIRDCLPQIEAQ
jgi:energy-coupling factor transporter ATP-binding protein EcfA2